MNKNEFIKAVAVKAEVSQVEALKCYEAMVDTLKSALSCGEKVSLLGFGSFEVRDRAARIGVNPKTGEKIEIAACKAVTFKAGKSMKENL